MMDLFDKKQIAPMLIAENVAPFTDDDYIYEMKWDGERCIAFLDPSEGTELRNKRNVRMLPKVPELANIHRQTTKRCILDGELLCLVDSKPSFETIQRRSLMSNRYKIELEAQRHPATFIAFDCLYYDGQNLTMQPLAERKKFLQKALAKESERLAIPRTFDTISSAYYQQVPKANRYRYPHNSSYVSTYICYFTLGGGGGFALHTISAGPQFHIYYSNLHPRDRSSADFVAGRETSKN